MGIAPIADAHSAKWWEAAADGRLLLQRCNACGARQFYPRAHCTSCLAPDPAWVEASGTGTLHTFTVVRKTPNAAFADDCPYVFAIVELDEGPRVTTRIVDADPAVLRCDQPVRVVFPEIDGEPVLPCFTPEEA
jgi:uncharacterized OB-fold protein